jgi:3-oxoacyl-[acyl-carrier protein] reductase
MQSTRLEDIPWREGRELSAHLDGRVAVVTGAGRGIGRAIALLLAGRGAGVACCDVLGDVGETATEAMRASGGRSALAAQVDVTDEAAVAAFVRRVEQELGPVDILVNNAGGTLGVRRRPIDEVDAADWKRIIEVNLYGAFYMVKAVAGGMKQRRWGKIVNISSGAGRSHSRTGIQAYTAAKAGLIGFTRQMAVELGPHNVNVNCVAPGLVLSTDEYRGNWLDRTEEQRVATVNSIALQRLGTVEDIAEAVAYLVSERGRYVSGQTWGVDGGHWMF